VGEEAEVGEGRRRELQVHGEPSGGGFSLGFCGLGSARKQVKAERTSSEPSQCSFLTCRAHFAGTPSPYFKFSTRLLI
jgi:hypothetical protein